MVFKACVAAAALAVSAVAQIEFTYPNAERGGVADEDLEITWSVDGDAPSAIDLKLTGGTVNGELGIGTNIDPSDEEFEYELPEDFEGEGYRVVAYDSATAEEPSSDRESIGETDAFEILEEGSELPEMDDDHEGHDHGDHDHDHGDDDDSDPDTASDSSPAEKVAVGFGITALVFAGML